MRSIHKQLSLLLLTALAACGSKIDNSPNVILETSLGAIEIEVYPEKAPLSAGAVSYTHLTLPTILLV